LTGGQALFSVMTCKSDMPASSLFVAGAVVGLSRGRSGQLGSALLMGMSAGAKMAYWPLVVVWGLVFWPGRRRIWWCLGLVLLPSVPWWLKTWLATGNPVYPYGSTFMPSLDWGKANLEAARLLLVTKLPGGVFPKPWDWPMRLRAEHLLALMMLPGLLVMGRERRAAWAVVGGQVLTLSVAYFGMYFLPGSWLLMLLVGREAAGSAAPGGMFGPLKGARKWVAWGLGAYALCFIWLAPQLPTSLWRDMFRPWATVQRGTFTTFLDVEKILTPADGKIISWRPGGRRMPRLLSVGEWRTYRFPGRLLLNGMFGETPIVWRLARESRDVPELAKRFHQLGAPKLLYNFVSVEWSEMWYGPFPWDMAALRRYVEFTKRHLVIATRTEVSDFLNGGFYVFDILTRPLAKPPATVWFAPGTEGIYGDGLVLENQRKSEEALRFFLDVNKKVPDVGASWNLVGHAYSVLNDSANAYKYLAKFGFTGMMDSMNLGELGAAAVRVGRLNEAEKVLTAAQGHYPNHRNAILINQASLWGQRALQEIVARRVGKAEEDIKKGIEIISGVPENLDEQNSKARRIAYANLWGLSGEIALIRGDGGAAMKWFQDALKLGPESMLAARWREIITALSPRMFGQSQ